MKPAVVIAFLALASCACAGERAHTAGDRKSPDKSSEPYWYFSETAPWYDSYGRLRHGYKDAPMKDYPAGKEPYYYRSESAPWYDSYGRLRYGPAATDTKTYSPGKEPYYHYSDTTPWYDSYGRLRYGPKGIPAEE
jgi:hypothetical protein